MDCPTWTSHSSKRTTCPILRRCPASFLTKLLSLDECDRKTSAIVGIICPNHIIKLSTYPIDEPWRRVAYQSFVQSADTCEAMWPLDACRHVFPSCRFLPWGFPRMAQACEASHPFPVPASIVVRGVEPARNSEINRID